MIISVFNHILGGTGGFGSTGTTSAFGTNPQQNQPTQGAGLFGTTPSTGTSAFNGFGLFPILLLELSLIFSRR